MINPVFVKIFLGALPEDIIVNSQSRANMYVMRALSNTGAEKETLIGAPRDIFMEQDEKNNITLPSGLYTFRFQADFDNRNTNRQELEFYVVPNFKFYVNDIQVNSLPTFNFKAGNYYSIPPVVFNFAIKTPTGKFRFENLDMELRTFPGNDLVAPLTKFTFKKLTLTIQKIADFPIITKESNIE
jgi:hypothetical protein